MYRQTASTSWGTSQLPPQRQPRYEGGLMQKPSDTYATQDQASAWQFGQGDAFRGDVEIRGLAPKQPQQQAQQEGLELKLREQEKEWVLEGIVEARTRAEDVDIQVAGSELTVKIGRFSQKIRIPENTSAKKFQASLDKNQLRILMPKETRKELTKEMALVPTEQAEHKNPVCLMMERTTVKELLAAKSVTRGPITFNDDLSIGECVNRLAKNRILSAPVIDANGVCLGFVDVLDICVFVSSSSTDPSKLESDSLQAWQILGHHLKNTPVREVVNLSRRDPFIPVFENKPIIEAAKIFAQGIHRVAVFNDKRELVAVFSQGDLIKWCVGLFNSKNGELRAFSSKRIRDFGYTGKSYPLELISTHATVIQCLWKLSVKRITGLGIIQDEGRLCGNFSASDLKGLYFEQFQSLRAPVGDFLMEYSPESLKPRVEPKETRSLKETMTTFGEEHLRRLWVVDESFKPVGVFTLTDMVNIMLKGE